MPPLAATSAIATAMTRSGHDRPSHATNAPAALQ